MVESIGLYTCSKVPAGHPTGLEWQPAAAATAGAVTGVAVSTVSTVERVLDLYEVHHRPQAAS